MATSPGFGPAAQLGPIASLILQNPELMAELLSRIAEPPTADTAAAPEGDAAKMDAFLQALSAVQPPTQPNVPFQTAVAPRVGSVPNFDIEGLLRLLNSGTPGQGIVPSLGSLIGGA